MSSMTKALLALLAASSASAVPAATGHGGHSTATGNNGHHPNIIPAFAGTKASPVKPLDPATVPSIVADLRDAPTEVDRFQKLLTTGGDTLLKGEALRQRTIFDFNQGDKPAPNATGGAIALANIASFPILTDLGISVAMGFLGPCGLNTPHTHPRASEFLTLVDGDVLETGFILENGFVDAKGVPLEVRTTIGKNQGTVFPVGSNHWQFNPTCHHATFVAALSNEDPGVSQIAQNFFNLEGKVIEATLGFPEQIDGKDLWQFKQSIPANVAEIVDNCLATCGYRR